MNKFVVVSFAFMAWAFYELSGGSDFEPKIRHEIAEVQPQKSLVSTEPARITPTSIEPVVTKAAAVVPTVKRTPSPRSDETPTTQVVQTSFHAVSAASSSAFQTPKATTPSLTTALKSTDTSDSFSQALANGMVILPEQKKDMRSVRGSRVNLRGGPGTSFGVLGVLNRDQAVEVLRDEGKGWVKLRDQESGRVGWMAAKMLTQKTE